MVSLTPLYRQLTNGFHSLHGAPSQLWVVYALKLLESYNYFSYVLVRLAGVVHTKLCTIIPPNAQACSFLYVVPDRGLWNQRRPSWFLLWPLGKLRV